jgi:hypothetical protein
MWGVGDITQPFLTLTLDEYEWRASQKFLRTPGEIATCIHWIGGRWVTGSVWTLWKWEQPCHAANGTPVVQPITPPYGDWALLNPTYFVMKRRRIKVCRTGKTLIGIYTYTIQILTLPQAQAKGKHSLCKQYARDISYRSLLRSKAFNWIYFDVSVSEEIQEN